VVPNVAVSVTNEATNAVFSATTSEVGNYSFTTLIPGAYKVHAELSGFRPVTSAAFKLQVNQTARHDLVMQVGQVSEKVEVAATLATLATDTSDVGQGGRQPADRRPASQRPPVSATRLADQLGVITSGSAGGDKRRNRTSPARATARRTQLPGGRRRHENPAQQHLRSEHSRWMPSASSRSFQNAFAPNRAWRVGGHSHHQVRHEQFAWDHVRFRPKPDLDARYS